MSRKMNLKETSETVKYVLPRAVAARGGTAPKAGEKHRLCGDLLANLSRLALSHLLSMGVHRRAC